MSQIIPLRPLANQILTVNLANQPCQIRVYQYLSGLYLDIICPTMVNGGLYGVICQNLNRIVRDLYLGFVGDLCFVDSQGDSDPDFTGLGGRFNLAYLETSDLAGEG